MTEIVAKVRKTAIMAFNCVCRLSFKLGTAEVQSCLAESRISVKVVSLANCQPESLKSHEFLQKRV